MKRSRPRPLTPEDQRAREEFDAFVASITPADYDPTFDNEAIEDVGHLDGACEDVLELAGQVVGGGVRRPLPRPVRAELRGVRGLVVAAAEARGGVAAAE